jgi:hypothetical protein
MKGARLIDDAGQHPDVILGEEGLRFPLTLAALWRALQPPVVTEEIALSPKKSRYSKPSTPHLKNGWDATPCWLLSGAMMPKKLTPIRWKPTSIACAKKCVIWAATSRCRWKAASSYLKRAKIFEQRPRHPVQDCYKSTYHGGGLAQWLEQGAHNALVGGSSPSSPTTLRLRLRVVQPSEVDFRRRSVLRSSLASEGWTTQVLKYSISTPVGF